jgi:hypothetical protein
MSDDVAGVLREIADLLRERVHQTADFAKRSEERLAGMPRPRSIQFPDFAATQAKYDDEAKLRREESTRHRQEDVEFRERLLATLERQNELLSRVISRSREP